VRPPCGTRPSAAVQDDRSLGTPSRKAAGAKGRREPRTLHPQPMSKRLRPVLPAIADRATILATVSRSVVSIILWVRSRPHRAARAPSRPTGGGSSSPRPVSSCCGERVMGRCRLGPGGQEKRGGSRSTSGIHRRRSTGTMPSGDRDGPAGGRAVRVRYAQNCRRAMPGRAVVRDAGPGPHTLTRGQGGPPAL